MKQEYKKLTYAYYSSPDAYKLNKGLGCWIVRHNDNTKVFQDNERFNALKYFESINSLPHPIESFTRQSLPFQNIISDIEVSA